MKVVLDQRLHNTFSKNNAPCVLLSLMLTRPFLNSCCLVGVCFLGFMHSSSSSCIRLPLTASNSNPPCIGRWLTSVKFRCKVDVNWFNKLFLTNQDRPYISGPEMAWNMQMSTDDNSPSTHYDRLRWQQICIVHVDFRTFWKLCVCILRNIGVLPYCLPIFVLIRANTNG